MLVFSDQDFRYPSVEGVVADYFVRDASGRVRPVAAAWADWDRHGRLLRATRDGRLEVAQVEQGKVRTLWSADLNDLQPMPVPAPGWATRW